MARRVTEEDELGENIGCWIWPSVLILIGILFLALKLALG